MLSDIRPIHDPMSRQVERQELHVLLVEDSKRDAELIVNALECGGYDVFCERVYSADAMTTALQQATWDVILSDYRMPTFSGRDALDLLNATGLDIPLLIISDSVFEETARELVQTGAREVIEKRRLSLLIPAIERVLRPGKE
jgi:CheY-like chemotaxis protein